MPPIQSVALQNLLSLLRAVGSLLGAYLVGHAIFGHTVSQDTLGVIGGAALTLASTIWGIATKSSTIEGIESSLRSIGAAVGGLFVAAGKISADQLLTILGAIVPIVAFIQSVVSKSKNRAVASGAATVSKTTNKVVAMLAVLLCLGTMASAQSPFQAQGPLAAPSVPKTDSVLNAYRFGVAVSPAGVTLAGVYQASAGVSFGIQHQDYNYATQVYSVLWSASVVWIPINTATKIQSIKDIATFGALVGFKNNLINVGPFYNPNAPGVFKDKFGFWFTTTINLNN